MGAVEFAEIYTTLQRQLFSDDDVDLTIRKYVLEQH